MRPPNEDREPLPWVAWSTVALLWFAGGSNYLTRTMLGTMRESVLRDIAMTDAQFGLLTSAFLSTYAVACPFGGYFADRFSRRWVVIIGLFAWALLTLATAFVPGRPEFLVLRAALGVAQAFYIPAAVAMIVEYHRGPTRALATGLHLTGLVCGAVLGGVAGWLAETHGWRYPYGVIGAASVLLGFVLVAFLHEPPRQAAPAAGGTGVSLSEAWRSLVGARPFRFMAGCMAVQGAISWIIIAWMPTVMREQFQLRQGAAGLSTLGFLYSAQTAGLIFGGIWSDRWSLTNPRSRIMVPAVAILIASPAFALTGWYPHFGLTVLSLCLWGVAMGFLGANTMPILCLFIDARYRATALGTLNCFTAVTGGLAIYGVGALRDARIGVDVILTVTSVGGLACGVMLWLANTCLARAEPAAGR
ncbi:MAG TPA: MFS transporter [Opitutaceae bacterium]|nr:MFS transporter [Opitutaceae bacterium]HND62729.1 MFS transporter [Opitutaceae bacterium]